MLPRAASRVDRLAPAGPALEELLIDSLLLLPLDERPINVHFPRLLAAMLGWALESPTEYLGSRKRGADRAAIATWLQEKGAPSPAGGGPVGAIIAIDTLAWGGLIPSRQSGNDLDAALEHLQSLRHLKRSNPNLPVMAYSSIQRVSRENDDGEEPAYYRLHGRNIFRRSQLEHRAAAGALEAGEAEELEALRRTVPADVWNDQVAIRERTMAINLAALDLVADGVVDVLVLNQDDTAVWGLNIMNRRRLEAEVRRRRLGDRVLVYPGADEVAQVLLARLAAQVRGKRTTVGTLFSSRLGPTVQTAYEDRPLSDLITVHLRAAGAVREPGNERPDWWLAVNSPSGAQGQGGVQYSLEHGDQVLSAEERRWLEAAEAPVNGADRSVEAFRDRIQLLLGRAERVSVADVAHVNGADDELMRLLASAGALAHLVGYGGWNTAGNSLGSAVALGCLAALGADEGALQTAVAARYVDDWLYQARVRSRLLLDPELRPLGLGGFVPELALKAVEARARAWLEQELAEFGLPYSVSHLSLPWQRVFEIDYRLERAS